ncbi:hypothetical protein Pmani_010824 [Petrolisthes manimaculis]|uniref:Potassium channel domain-containing protein n=1 Tax=Petrolisthes manimaculis TaxID=1843537 RepID=A0AAE1UF45_9EUCA|nr:hypothetical protein Pmani_010824 [Petrolisthes manimaculis]
MYLSTPLNFLLHPSFQQLEDPLGEGGELVEVRRSTVTLPGTPRHPDMTRARQELVERLINTSSGLILERSQEVVIAAIFTSSRLQSALQAFQQGGGSRLPPDKQLERLSRSVMTEWRQQMHHLTARYHTLVTRHALGMKVDDEKRSAVWNEEEPPPPLPWRTSHALLYAFCLLTTVGGGVRAQTPGGRVAGVLFTMVGVVLYVAVVGVWAARLRDTAIIVIKMFSRKKIQARESKNSSYHNMQQHHHSSRLSSDHQSTSSPSSSSTATTNTDTDTNTTSTTTPTTTTNTTTTANTNNSSNPSLLLHPHLYHPHHSYHHHHNHYYHNHHRSLSTHPYHNTHARSALFLIFAIVLYLVSVGTQAVAGETFWAGLENAIQALLCVHPPNPLPQDLSTITGFMAFTFFGHLLLALFLYNAKEWWWVWWRGRATPS